MIRIFQKGFRKKFTQVKTAKGRKISSTRWLSRQLNDPFNLMSKEKGYRSRASFKLLEIEDKFKIVKSANIILDLGCAPGSWMQIVKEINPNNKLIGIDLSDIEEIVGSEFIKGDFLEKETQDQLTDSLKGKQADLILSDMAPYTSGHKDTDALRLIVLLEEVLLFAKENLKKQGNLIAKLFLGVETDTLIKEYKKQFEVVKFFKPQSSRKKSKEQYVICLNKY